MSEIFVDADACPVKAEIIRVAERHGIVAHIVSNSGFRTNANPLIRNVLVSDKFDAADDWIVARAGPGDIVITADIQLADRCLKAGAEVIGNTGKPFTENSIGTALAMRELSSQLRDMGEIRGGGPIFSQADRSRFLNALEAAVQRAKRRN
ncbi:MAG: YaiI/YqxD family protein [Rhodospirillaceae bacterium]|nr:YaiI/YqxD family protein [Rhodospirillaceae bacterium]